jgi:hypothetical protein
MCAPTILARRIHMYTYHMLIAIWQHSMDRRIRIRSTCTCTHTNRGNKNKNKNKEHRPRHMYTRLTSLHSVSAMSTCTSLFSVRFLALTIEIIKKYLNFEQISRSHQNHDEIMLGSTCNKRSTTGWMCVESITR